MSSQTNLNKAKGEQKHQEKNICLQEKDNKLLMN